ncbi:MAG: hypothetical protein PHW52_01790 [Candidatus Pacebacteria bacterium]|nr:hypothetical protein [Candidatus Paceibacterota bacterium]
MVKVGIVGGKVFDVIMPKGDSLKKLLASIEEKPDNYQVFQNGIVCENLGTVAEGDLIALVPMPKKPGLFSSLFG